MKTIVSRHTRPEFSERVPDRFITVEATLEGASGFPGPGIRIVYSEGNHFTYLSERDSVNLRHLLVQAEQRIGAS